MAFAKTPPKIGGALVRRLRVRFLRPGIDDQPPVEPPLKDDQRSKALLNHLKKWQNAPTAAEPLEQEPEMFSLKRQMRKKRGNWWQVPKDLPDSD